METGPHGSGQEGVSALRAFLAWSTGREGGWQAGEGLRSQGRRQAAPGVGTAPGGGEGQAGGEAGWGGQSQPPPAPSPYPQPPAALLVEAARGLDLGLKDLELGSFLLQSLSVSLLETVNFPP